mgnify:CR=1 FL=1|tara:strand:- start:1423 stop:1629 length:207 start_codon:yes stop_codon:yes gene_type:complete
MKDYSSLISKVVKKSPMHVYTVRLPNNLLTGLFVNYTDALNWQEIMEGEETVMVHIDHDTYNTLAPWY